MGKMRWAWSLVCGVIVVVGLLRLQEARAESLDRSAAFVLPQMVRQTGATLTREDALDWSIVSNQFESEADLKRRAEALNSSLAAGTPVMVVHNTPEETGVALDSQWAGGDTLRIVFASMRSKGAEPLTTVSIDVTHRSSSDHLAAMERQLEAALRSSNISPSVRLCAQGLTTDRLVGPSAYASILHTFAQHGTQPIEALRSQLETSVSGLDSAFPDNIQASKRVNIQMAEHYASALGGTVITVGSPIITIEY